MAQLPPKIPISSSNMSNWPIINPLFPHPHHQLIMTAANGWDVADEFADFAAARRGSHRRSASDSVAFLEPLMMINQVHHGQDDHDDDDELMMIQSCMLISSSPDDMSSAAAAPPTLSSPSTDPSSPSDGAANNINNINNIIMGMMINDHNNISNINGNNIVDDLFKAEPGEVESPPPPPPPDGGDPYAPPSPSSPAAADSVFDPKRVKRILANRQSAQRSRVRKLQYISELERSVTTLQSEVSALSPRVAFLDHQRLILNVDNSALKQRIAALAQDKIFKDAHQEALKKEIERLRQVYHQQNLKKMANQNSQDRNSDDALGCTDNDHIPN